MDLCITSPRLYFTVNFLCRLMALICWTLAKRGLLSDIIPIYISYSTTSLIRTNWERAPVEISGSPNYRIATENMLREVIKWISRVFLGNTTLFWNSDCIS
jgi:hypothetical protein